MSSFDYSKTTVFFRDSFVPFKDANLSIGSSPVLYGLAIYTVFSLNWNDKEKKLFIFRLEDHYSRLVNSAKIMDFNSFQKSWPYSRFEKMVFDLINKNKIKEDALVRVCVFIDALLAGTKIHDLPNSFSAYIYPMGEILPRSGVKLCVSSWCRNPDNAIPARAKVNGGYVNSSLMKNEALQNGFDDAVALDRLGNVTEGTIANIFLIKNTELITPSTTFDILPGITRDSIITIAKDMGLLVIERPVNRSELYTCDEAFLTGSSARVTPILSIDRREIGNGIAGEITLKLVKKLEEIQRGEVNKYGKWRKGV